MARKKSVERNLDHLVDINDIHIDNSLPKQERVNEFVKQIKNPYHFKCGKFEVIAKFSDNGPTLEECVRGLIS